MRKHRVVAFAAALAVMVLSARTTLATQEIVVQPGETLQSISWRVYGDDTHGLAIARVNHLAVSDQLQPGMRLLLPGDAAPAIAAPPPPAAPDSGAGAPATADNPPSLPPVVALPVLAGPASPDGAPAPGSLPDALAAGPVIQTGLATWYGPGFNGGVTYCGEVYDQWSMTAASNTLPCGTVVVVTNQSTGLAVRLRITDRGGFGGSVILDLSRAAFLSIAPSASGVIPVSVALPAQ